MGRRPRFGTVTAFDPDRGLGEVSGEDGTVLPFHCTALVDGTRMVAVGTAVCFVAVPGHLGRTEAREVTPVPE